MHTSPCLGPMGEGLRVGTTEGMAPGMGWRQEDLNSRGVLHQSPFSPDSKYNTIGVSVCPQPSVGLLGVGMELRKL